MRICSRSQRVRARRRSTCATQQRQPAPRHSKSKATRRHSATLRPGRRFIAIRLTRRARSLACTTRSRRRSRPASRRRLVPSRPVFIPTSSTRMTPRVSGSLAWSIRATRRFIRSRRRLTTTQIVTTPTAIYTLDKTTRAVSQQAGSGRQRQQAGGHRWRQGLQLRSEGRFVHAAEQRPDGGDGRQHQQHQGPRLVRRPGQRGRAADEPELRQGTRHRADAEHRRADDPGAGVAGHAWRRPEQAGLDSESGPGDRERCAEAGSQSPVGAGHQRQDVGRRGQGAHRRVQLEDDQRHQSAER